MCLKSVEMLKQRACNNGQRKPKMCSHLEGDSYLTLKTLCRQEAF